MEIDRSTQTVTIRNGPKSKQVRLGRFHSLLIERESAFFPIGYRAILVGEENKIEIAGSLTKASIMEEAEAIADWLAIPASES